MIRMRLHKLLIKFFQIGSIFIDIFVKNQSLECDLNKKLPYWIDIYIYIY